MTSAQEPQQPRAIDVIRRCSVEQRRSIKVPEWEGLELFFGKITVADMQAVEEREPKTPQERNVILVIHKAQDKAGKPVFSFGDMHYLVTEADFVVLQRVWNFMFESAYTPAEAKEAIKTDPPSASA